MVRKTSLFIVSVFAIVLFSGLASAAITVEGIPSTLSQDVGTFDFNITVESTFNETVDLSVANIVGDGAERYSITFELSNNSILLNSLNNNTAIVNIEYTVQSGFDFELMKDYSTKLTIFSNNESKNYTKDLDFEETEFCEYNNEAKIILAIDDVNVVTGFGDEDDYWYLMDKIEVQVTVEPKDYDIDHVDGEWELYNTAGKKIDDGDFSISNIDEDDEETASFTFTLDSNIDDFESEDAVLYIRATGKIDADSDDDNDGERSCDWVKRKVQMHTDDDFVIPTNIKVNNEKAGDFYIPVNCGEEITLDSDIVNIGEDKQEDLYVEIYSKDLDVYKKIEYDRIRAFDSEKLEYVFNIPEGLTEGKYTLSFEVFDEDSDIFENDEDDKAVRTIYFAVAGNCKAIEPKITAELNGLALSGKEMIINSTITNKEDSAMTYTIVADGFSGWSSLVGISPEIIALDAGESKEVSFRFNVDDDAVGEKFFNIQVLKAGKIIASQAASVNIEKPEFKIDNVKDFLTNENLKIIGIVLLNLILVIFIIVVARKLLKKK